jgi:hypothetical protein
MTSNPGSVHKITSDGSIIVGGTPEQVTLELPDQPHITPGRYEFTNVTVNKKGIITAINTNTFSFISPMTTKGDIIVHNGEEAVCLPVGSDDEVLVADSEQSTGLKWETRVQQVDTGTGLTGGPITGVGTLSIADTGVKPGSYTFPDVTFNAQGQATSAASNTFTGISPLTSKGDIIVHNGEEAVCLPVGRDDEVLVADSTQSTGLKWASPVVNMNVILVRLHKTTPQSVPNETETILTFSSGISSVPKAITSKGWDEDNGEFTVQVDGIYRVYYSVTFDTVNGDGIRSFGVLVKGDKLSGGDYLVADYSVPASSSVSVGGSSAGIILCSAGTRIMLNVSQTSGKSLDATPNNFYIELVKAI